MNMGYMKNWMLISVYYGNSNKISKIKICRHLCIKWNILFKFHLKCFVEQLQKSCLFSELSHILDFSTRPWYLKIVNNWWVYVKFCWLMPKNCWNLKCLRFWQTCHVLTSNYWEFVVYHSWKTPFWNVANWINEEPKYLDRNCRLTGSVDNHLSEIQFW